MPNFDTITVSSLVQQEIRPAWYFWIVSSNASQAKKIEVM